MLLSSCHQATQVFVLCAITYSTCVHFLDKVCVMNIKGRFTEQKRYVLIIASLHSRANDPFATSRTELTAAGFKFNGGSHTYPNSHMC